MIVDAIFWAVLGTSGAFLTALFVIYAIYSPTVRMFESVGANDTDTDGSVLGKKGEVRGHDTRLTEVGFDIALAVSLQKHWPDIATARAIKWLREYIGVPFGAEGYEWTVSAASEIADRFVMDLGELQA